MREQMPDLMLKVMNHLMQHLIVRVMPFITLTIID